MPDIGQAFADASWGNLVRFFLAGSERGRGTSATRARSPATAESLKTSTTRFFSPPPS